MPCRLLYRPTAGSFAAAQRTHMFSHRGHVGNFTKLVSPALQLEWEHQYEDHSAHMSSVEV
jgi:hypothetical protein